MAKFQIIQFDNFNAIISNGKIALTEKFIPGEGADLEEAAKHFKELVEKDLEAVNAVYSEGFGIGRVEGAIVGCIAAIGASVGTYLTWKIVRSKKAKKE